MSRWEYKRVSRHDLGVELYGDQLNGPTFEALGEGGWELAGIESWPSSPADAIYYVFKRAKEGT